MISTNIEKAPTRKSTPNYGRPTFTSQCRAVSPPTTTRESPTGSKIQHREEMDHAYMMIDYLVRRGGKVTLEPIADVLNRMGLASGSLCRHSCP